MSKMGDSTIKKLSGSTVAEVIRTSYTWTVHNFSFLVGEKSKKVKSAIFSAGDKNEYRWRLRMYPNGCELGSNTHISLFLQLVSPTETEVQAKFDFSIVMADGQRHTLASHKIRSFVQWRSLGYHELIERNDLLDEHLGYLCSDTLRLICDVAIGTGKVSSQTNVEEPSLVRAELNLARDFENMFRQGLYADVSLLVDDVHYDVHRSVLSARSPVFAAMFHHDMLEKQLSEVRIVDVDRATLGELLRFVYTGRVEDLDLLADRLLAAADKYALEDLKLICESYFYRHLTVDNVVNTLVLADRHNAPGLKEHVVNFIKANAIRLVDNFTNLVLYPS